MIPSPPSSLRNALPPISGYILIALAAFFAAVFLRSEYYKEAMLFAVLALFAIRIYNHPDSISRKIISTEIIYACSAYIAIVIIKISTLYFFTELDPIGHFFQWFWRHR